MAMCDAPRSPQGCRFERAIPLRESKGNIGPFRATQIWNEIICHLKARVEVKRRRHKMRHYDNCFTGTDAVDVVLHYLLNDRETFSTDLSREKAVKLCQTLMNKSIFEPVVCRVSEGKQVFEDSNNKLYRFPGYGDENKDPDGDLNDSDLSVFEEMEEFKRKRGEMRVNYPFESDLLNDGVICNSAAIGRSGSVMQELARIGSSIKCKSSSSLKAGLIDAKSTRTGDNPEITPGVVEETWKETALAQLLTMVEVAFLEGVLSEEKENKKQRRNLIISNVVAKHCNMPFLGGTEYEESVMHTAFDCIECLPKGMSLLSDDCLRQNGDYAKHKVYSKISKYYCDQSEPLLPERFVDLHLAILNLILTQREDTALEALKLDVILLPWAVREELQRLLKYMLAVSRDKSFVLNPQEPNEIVVLKAFSDAIFKHKLLAPNLGSVLVQFFLSHLKEIFTVPRSIREKVALRLFKLKTGDHLPVYESTFCDRISKEEYQRQSEECTQHALIEMMNSVLDDTQLLLKEKKQKLRQFQKCYPSLYDRYFQGML